MRIGEFAAATGTTTNALRFYEDKGLLARAPRTRAGYRDYTPAVIARVDFIHRGQAAGLTLAQVRQVLDIRDRGEAPCEHVHTLLDTRLADLEAHISRLVALRDTISQLRDQAARAEPESCPPSRVCRYL